MTVYWGTWLEWRCPKCRTSNMMNHGDIDDLTVFDPTACKCWKCHHGFDFEGNAVNDMEKCEDGRRVPSA